MALGIHKPEKRHLWRLLLKSSSCSVCGYIYNTNHNDLDGMKKIKILLLLLLINTISFAQYSGYVELLIEYSNECYNDSSYIEYYRYPSSTMIDTIAGLLVTPAIYYSAIKVCVWQHKEPSFKGFVQWVAIKYDLLDKMKGIKE